MTLQAVKDAAYFLVSSNPGQGAVTLAAPGSGGSSTYGLPMTAADDGKLFDITIVSVDANGNPLTGNGAKIEVQQRSTFTWNGGTNSTFSRSAGNVVNGTAGAGVLENFNASTQRVFVSPWHSNQVMLSVVSYLTNLHAAFGGV